MARDHDKGISRRTLLIGGGAGIGLVLAWRLWPRSYAPNLAAGEGETVMNAFLKIGRDGRVIVAVPQTELGQGVYTSLPQILADELGADWRTVAVEPAPVSPLYANTLIAEEAAGDSGWPGLFEGTARSVARSYAVRNALMLTGGSSSVRAFEPRLREAGAAARALLSMAAAERWTANWEELDTHHGFVWKGGDRIPFAELAEAAARFDPPEHLPVRGGGENRLTGRPLPRLDLPAKLDGSAVFAADIRFPDMVYAAARSGPPGSRLAAVEKAAADRVPGALKVFENPGWAAVAATNWWAAARALDALNPRFRIPAGPDNARVSATLAAALGDGGETIFESGDVDSDLPGASPVEARYEVGLAPSAAVEPLTATARVSGDRLEIWAPTQAPGLARAVAARAIGFSEGQVTLYPTLAGGGYGRKLEMAAIEQAATIALLMGRPVQLTWPRIQEIQRDSLRPAAAAQMTGWMRQGRLEAWRALIAAPRTSAEVAARIGAGSALIRPDEAAVAGAEPPYAIANVRIEHADASLGVETGLSRGAAHSYTCYFTECFVDELARAAGLEPLAFRMALLGHNPRLARCLATAASIGGWDGGGPGSGMGLACHSAFGSHIACLVEVEVTREQRLRALRAVAAVDCGRAINPEIARQQIEGGIVHGVSAAIGRPLELVNGIVQARSIGAYGLPILRDAPEVTVELLDSDEDPGGVTELGVPPAAPAVANAYFSLSGQRVRTLPIAVGGAR